MIHGTWLSTPLDRMRRHPTAVLAGLTIFAAVLRFFRLSTPCLWGDEAEVYWRTCGTFGQLLDVLRFDGFSPLHYEMHWVIGRVLGIKPTPVVLRFVPAVCGVLMVPAIYFLARQLVDRSTAVLAAGIAACSGYLLYFSRDAKMYAEVWLMVTLFVACLLWWFSNPTPTRWLCWVAAGAAAVGLQMTAAVVVGLSLLFLLTQSRMHWRRGMAWLAGVAVVMAGPAGYFGAFNQFASRSEQNWEKDSGLNWVGGYIWGRDGPDLMRLAGSAYAVGWEWPRSAEVSPPALPDWSWRHPIDRTVTVGGRLYVWVERSPFDALMIAAVLTVTGILVLGMIPWPRRWLGVREESPRPRWMSLLWILLWIWLPLYGFYCVSRPGFALPSDLLNLAGGWIGFDGHRRLWCAIFAIMFGCPIAAGLIVGVTRPGTIRTLKTAAVVGVVVGILQIMGTVMRPMAVAAAGSEHPWHPLWVPRYMGFVVPALIVAMATLLMRLPTVYGRTAGVAVVLGINLLVGERRTFTRTEPPTDLIAADDIAAADSNGRILTWFTTAQGNNGPGGGNLDSESGRYYLQMLAFKQPMSPERFRALSTEFPMETATPERFIPRRAENKSLGTVIVWDKSGEHFGPSGLVRDALPTADTLLPLLPGWRLSSEQWFDVNDFWTGKQDYRMRRRVYVRR